MPQAKKFSKIAKKKSAASPDSKKYNKAIGRRKLSVSIAKIFLASSSNKERSIIVNGKDYKAYFSIPELQDVVSSPLRTVQAPKINRVEVLSRGGGIRGQAESARLAIAKALVLHDESFRKPLRDLGFLTRDARVVERKKAGLKKARRAPQFSKR